MEDFNTILNGLLQNGTLGVDLYNQIKNNDAIYAEKLKKADEDAKNQKTVIYISFAIIIILIIILVSKLYKKI